MKWRALKTAFAAVLVIVLTTPAFNQNYYLVVGAFASPENDLRAFTSYIPGQSPDTSYTVKNGDNLMHLYVMKTSSEETAIASAKKLQQALEHDVRNAPSQGSLGFGERSFSLTPAIEPAEVTVANSSKTSDNVASAGSAAVKPKGKAFKFVIAKDDGQQVPALIHQVDFNHGREVRSFAADTYIDVLRPTQGEPMALVCDVFGYKMEEKFIDYNDPSITEGAYLDEEGAWVIPYRLERLNKGDVSVMRNLAFYMDAVVMLPSSKNELDNLVGLMTFNPNYSIRVHAHCNGKNSRKIIALGDNQNFFDVTGAAEIKGSAKQLTTLRADAIRNYLISQGIAENRVKIFGWGGAEMLVGQYDPHSKINDRVEIEILKD
jgi:outer membrane protein OmpA-like peptidoglycan-associated protein